MRENEHSELKVLSPCGVCQERLFYWGPKVQCAITNAKQDIIFKPLKELQPYHWTEAYHDEMAKNGVRDRGISFIIFLMTKMSRPFPNKTSEKDVT